jgi:hypothetical protein
MPLETLALDLAQDALLQLKGANLEDILLGEASLVASDQTSLRVAHAEHAGTEFEDLESGVLSDVAGTGDEDLGLGVGEGDTARSVTWVQERNHLLAVVDQAVSGGFGASVGTSPGWAFASEDTDPLVAELLVGSEKETDLATSSTLTVKDSLVYLDMD